jgi:hypothetical protein
MPVSETGKDAATFGKSQDPNAATTRARPRLLTTGERAAISLDHEERCTRHRTGANLSSDGVAPSG